MEGRSIAIVRKKMQIKTIATTKKIKLQETSCL